MSRRIEIVEVGPRDGLQTAGATVILAGGGMSANPGLPDRVGSLESSRRRRPPRSRGAHGRYRVADVTESPVHVKQQPPSLVIVARVDDGPAAVPSDVVRCDGCGARCWLSIATGGETIQLAQFLSPVVLITCSTCAAVRVALAAAAPDDRGPR